MSISVRCQLSGFVKRFDIYTSHSDDSKGPCHIHDKRWMIRGVGRDIRKAVKDAAKTEGVSVGAGARRSIVRALDVTADGPPSVIALTERAHVAACLSVLERSHRALHQEVHAANRLVGTSATEKRTRWRRTKKSK